MNISEIVNKITPLYNEYQADKNISWTDALKIMWDIWDILKIYITKYNIAPHKLFWSIYWKAEWINNTTQKSYITREFQNRCHRIKNIFWSKNDIDLIFPNLNNFNLFREAMPFFDNEKYKLKWKEKEHLLKLLNSNKSYSEIMQQIKILQKDKIWIKNPRTQKLHELEDEKKIFIDFYNMVFKTLNSKDFSTLKDDKILKDYILLLSKNTNSLSQDWLKFSEMSIEKDKTKNSLFNDYYSLISSFSLEKTPQKIRRFRRIIPVERIVKLADLLYSLYWELEK